MDIAALLTDVHQRSAKMLLRMQELQAQAQQVQAMVNQCQAELLRLDGEERALLGVQQTAGQADAVKVGGTDA